MAGKEIFKIVYTIFSLNLLTACACQCVDNSCIATPPTLSRTPALEKNGSSDTATAGDLRSLFFDYKSTTLNPNEKEALKKNIEFILLHPTLQLVVEGHADKVGGKNYNLKLAAKRAETIQNFMVQNSVPSDRIFMVSAGDAGPLSQDDTDETERKKDRRVNFVIRAI
ncbi:MAG: OmpA family protein [Bdellovibrionales bacterium]|nr:OmpA family protein [Oligoflexia bacterium]